MPTITPAATGAVALLVGTRKGAFILKSDRARRSWKLTGPLNLGQIIHHVTPTPRGSSPWTAAGCGRLPEIYAVEAEDLSLALKPGDQVQIVQALSGG